MLRRARFCPAVTLSPGSARISLTFRPTRSGRTKVSSRGTRMPNVSTRLGKQVFVAFRTVTAAPIGAAAGSSAASAGEDAASAKRATASGASRLREAACVIGGARGVSGGTDSRRSEEGPSRKDVRLVHAHGISERALHQANRLHEFFDKNLTNRCRLALCHQ